MHYDYQFKQPLAINRYPSIIIHKHKFLSSNFLTIDKKTKSFLRFEPKLIVVVDKVCPNLDMRLLVGKKN